jgi:OmpA-OmpF porin, OOP family
MLKLKMVLEYRKLFPKNSLELNLAEFVLASQEKSSKFTLDGINFLFNRTEIANDSSKKIKNVATILSSEYVSSIDIIGHTDSVGLPAANQRISTERATAAREVLLKNGIDPSNVTVRGAGGSEPIADNLTPEGRLKNRRIEIVVTK